MLSDSKKEVYIDLLKEIANIYKNQAEYFKERAYKTAINKLEMLDDNEDISEDIGKSAFQRLKEYDDTGKIELIEKEKSNVLHVFSDIYGIGPKKAMELSKKYKSIEELYRNTHELNDKQKIGLKFYEDSKLRIPRKEILKFEKKVKNILKNFKNSNINAEIVGSFRRGKPDSGDIDVIFSSDNQNDFDRLISEFNIEYFLTKGKKKVMCFYKINDVMRRIDFLYTPISEYPFALLYFTGSKLLNIKMRKIAKNDKELSLNEKGFFKGTKMIDDNFNSEEDIFDYLGMKYLKPLDR